MDVAAAAQLPDPHVSKVFLSRCPDERGAGFRRAGQLAWLTDDMLNPSTRTGGMDTRLK
jgi:hypothetical protein